MWILILLVIFMTTQDVSAQGSAVGRKCENDWARFGRTCYKYIAELKTWAEAEEYCISLGGNLAAIHSAQTQDFLKKLGRSKDGKYFRTWIGAHDGTQDFVWFWSDGSKFDFKAWHSGEPNNKERAEKCLEMNYGDEVLWNDARCSTKLYSVCQTGATLSFSSSEA
ncbi:hypothetical protein MHYP_G00094410 [Metynnis hypsauchen]